MLPSRPRAQTSGLGGLFFHSKAKSHPCRLSTEPRGVHTTEVRDPPTVPTRSSDLGAQGILIVVKLEVSSCHPSVKPRVLPKNCQTVWRCPKLVGGHFFGQSAKSGGWAATGQLSPSPRPQGPQANMIECLIVRVQWAHQSVFHAHTSSVM